MVHGPLKKSDDKHHMATNTLLSTASAAKWVNFAIFLLMKTPKFCANSSVYDPSDDTFLLMDALEADLHLLNPLICLEVGSGTGIVSAFVSKFFEVFHVAVDVNLIACATTRDTGKLNHAEFDVVNGNLTAGLRLNGAVDVLLFNPPYVLTSPSEVGKKTIEAAWAGGIDGRQVIDQFLPLVPVFCANSKDILTQSGIFYLVVINENRPDEICQIMRSYGLHSRTLMYRKAGFEGLSVLAFSKTDYSNPL